MSIKWWGTLNDNSYDIKKTFQSRKKESAIAAGADGVMIEVHNNPEKALCDGKQSLTPESFTELMKKVRKTTEFFQKEM